MERQIEQLQTLEKEILLRIELLTTDIVNIGIRLREVQITCDDAASNLVVAKNRLIVSTKNRDDTKTKLDELDKAGADKTGNEYMVALAMYQSTRDQVIGDTAKVDAFNLSVQQATARRDDLNAMLQLDKNQRTNYNNEVVLIEMAVFQLMQGGDQ